ncbi:hypothetical protein Nmel_003063 [Mimus melanotis]
MSEKRVEEAPAELSAKERKEKKEKVEEKAVHKEKKKEIVEDEENGADEDDEENPDDVDEEEGGDEDEEADENGQEQDGHAEKRSAEEEERMKWIQRDRRQKTVLQLESSPPISPVPSISPPPFQPVLTLPISLWLHTISDEERLEMLSKWGRQQFPPHPKT